MSLEHHRPEPPHRLEIISESAAPVAFGALAIKTTANIISDRTGIPLDAFDNPELAFYGLAFTGGFLSGNGVEKHYPQSPKATYRAAGVRVGCISILLTAIDAGTDFINTGEVNFSAEDFLQNSVLVSLVQFGFSFGRHWRHRLRQRAMEV